MLNDQILSLTDLKPVHTTRVHGP